MNLRRILFSCFLIEAKGQLLYRVMPNDEPMSLDMAQTDNIEFFSWAETESGRLVIGSRNRLLIYESNKNGYLEEVSSITIKPEAITKSNCQRSGGTEEDCDNCLVAIGIDEESIWACGTYAHRPMLYYFENGQASYKAYSSMTCPKSNRRSAFLKIAQNDARSNSTATANFEQKSIFIASDDPNHAYLEKSALSPVKTVLESESFSSEYHNEKQWFEAPDMHLLVDLPERVLLIFAGGHRNSRRNMIGSVLKSDRGGYNDARSKFTSFRKVPFVCRSSSSVATFTFANLATAIEGEDEFLAIFKTVNGRGEYESAMCSYSYKNIREYLDSGNFDEYSGPRYEAADGKELVSSPIVLIDGEVIAALQSSADQFFFGLADGKVLRVTVRDGQEPILANIDSPEPRCGKVKSLLMRRNSHLVIAWEKCLLETKGDKFHVKKELETADKKDLEGVFQERLSQMENKMKDLHDVINALTARIYTENDNRSLGEVLGDFDLLKVKVESAEEIAQRRVDEIYEKLEKRIEDLDRRALQCCSASSSPKPTPAFRLNHVMQLDEPVSVVAEKLNQIEQQMDFFDKETQRLKSDQKELQSGTWTYTKQVVDDMRKFCYQKQKTSMNWVVDLKSNVTELEETINEVSNQLRRVKRRVDKKGRKNRRKRKTGKKPREYELVIPELSLSTMN
ncbi:Oidioi.mRNA.OKI2018_I69.PAR.g11957.t1.cds [Oikopleura dioica]|uniref:Oidioi.mRNA.OKI2018_I69.PAR.g11957.t1.cds n=1 Tax=Oikopleura dioica TaxID=34765 RepID=A0ABN7S4U1_OIKDI|nr:Oidioi.mRNA.OKI2018_I69.PAR.g11957.t1.cds [Oikopleura dioica]